MVTEFAKQEKNVETVITYIINRNVETVITYIINRNVRAESVELDVYKKILYNHHEWYNIF